MTHLRRLSLRIAAGLSIFGALAGLARAEDPAPAPLLMRTTPEMLKSPAMHPAPGFEVEGMRAIFYEGMPWQGKPTRVFAWLGMPEVKPGQKVPGIVLVHGGGGTAFSDWVKLWTARGYAAIAMDTCGAVPRGTYGKWERHDAGGPPGYDLTGAGRPIEDQWNYHAVADVILAHSLLRSLPEVDADRTGLTGISWGGYLTCIASGLDDRFKFAAPVYGCGFLGENSHWKPELEALGEPGARWLAMWDPSHYLPAGKMPKLWVTGTNDFAYPLDSLGKSARVAGGRSTLCVRLRMAHGHGGAGENPEEIRAFADSVVNGGKPLAEVVSAELTAEGTARVASKSEAPIARAELLFTKDAGPWTERRWEVAEASIDPKSNDAVASLPTGTTACYINLIDDRGLIVSGPVLVVK